MRKTHWRTFSLLVALFATIHLSVYLLSANRSPLGPALSGGTSTAAAALLANAYPLVAVLLIAFATWFGVGGWHGLFVTTMLIFLYHVVDPNLDGVHNFADMLLQNRVCFVITRIQQDPTILP